MDTLMKAPHAVQIVIGAALLLVIDSFFDWQQVSLLGITAGQSEWHGIGILAGLLVIAVLVWEVARLFDVVMPDDDDKRPGLASLGIALLAALFTIITFLTHDKVFGLSTRHWPAWVGLILAIVLAIAAVLRALVEGVATPKMKQPAS